MTTRHAAFRSWLAVSLVLGAAVLAEAQARARVTADSVNVWRDNFLSVITVLNTGAEVDLLGRRGNWYEVRLIDRAATRGLINVAQLEVIAGEPPVDSGRGAARDAPCVPSPARSLRGFAQVGYTRWHASRTFDAVLGSPGGLVVGGGGSARFGSLFVQGAVDVFRGTGERVVVDGGEVFPLGIEDVVTVVPVTATAGYTARLGGRDAYVGGGVGLTFYRETAEFGTEDDEVSERFVGYHALAGVDVYRRRAVGLALEVQYSHVPDALDGGAAESFDEHNLGSVQLRLKVSFGR